MTKTTATFGIAIAVLTLNSCVPSRGRCFPYMEKAGYFCYKSHNFGRNVTTEYKQGVRDGCTTGEGRFRRDYRLSSYSEEYRKGWDAGRAECRLIVPDEAKPGLRTQYQQSVDMNKSR